MARTRHAVGQHAGPGHLIAVVLQTKGQRTKSTGHGRGIHHSQNMKAKALRQIGRAGLTVEQAHDAFHQNQIRVLRSRMQARAAVGLARHPQIELVHRRAAGQGVPIRV